MRVLLTPLFAVRNFLEFLGHLAFLLLDAAIALPRALILGRGKRMGWHNLWAQMVRVGVKAIPIVFLVLFCIGAILAFQMAPTLAEFGQVAFVPDIIAVAVFRELGPLVAAVVLTGFAGASIAAEIGSMVVSEEIEALEAHAVSPIRFLVVPRVLATIVMTVCLAVLADLSGVLGGMVVSESFLGVSWRLYIQHTFSSVQVQDFITGLIKAGVFGAIVSSFACHLGLSVSGGAEGVGNATTRTVVLTIVALIFTDLLFTAVFYFMGW